MRLEVGTNDIAQILSKAADEVSDLTPLMQSIGDLMIASTKSNFVDGTAPDGTPWAPRSQTTLDAYARRGDKPAGGPLVGVTKILSTTIDYEAGPQSVDWGSNRLYAAVMQFGAAQGEFGARIGKDKNGRDFFTTIPWGDIPARPFLGVGPDDENAIIQDIEDWFESIFDE